MPTYSYACTECHNDFDIVQAFTDESLTVCPVCSGRLRKKFGTVGIVFKGSGFYRNDSRSGAKGEGSDGGSDKAGSDKGASEKGGSEKGGSDQGASEKGGPDRGASDRGASDKGASDKGRDKGSGKGGDAGVGTSGNDRGTTKTDRAPASSPNKPAARSTPATSG